MKNLLIACLLGALTTAIPATADAHWHHPHHVWHRVWHHVWHPGVSYYRDYGYFNDGPFGPICVWHRNWDAYWHRDCF
jgi:hypothetical protein